MKSEPEECSIDDALAAPRQTVPWFGVRNYQARNFMRDLMQPQDRVLFYHSSCAVPGIYGLAEVASKPYPDPSQFDRLSPYFDARSTSDTPRWILVDVKALKKTRVLPLSELRQHQGLQSLELLRRGSRLSITPVSATHFQLIERLL